MRVSACKRAALQHDQHRRHAAIVEELEVELLGLARAQHRRQLVDPARHAIGRVGVGQRREMDHLGGAVGRRQAHVLRRPCAGLLVEVALGAELLEVDQADAVDELGEAALAQHHRDLRLGALAAQRLLDRHGVVELHQPHHLGVDVAQEDDLVLGVAQHLEIGVAGALDVAAQLLADGREGHARPRLVEELLQRLDLGVVLRVLGLFLVALEIVAGAVDIGHHGLDAGQKRVVLLRQTVEHAQLVGRLEQAGCLGAADIELLVLVFRLEGVALDRGGVLLAGDLLDHLFALAGANQAEYRALLHVVSHVFPLATRRIKDAPSAINCKSVIRRS